MATFVLVHGAWHGGWCWHKLARLLDSRGHTVLTPDLPGHGDDPTPLAEIGSEAYRDRIREVLQAQTEPVVLVGHSMGGLVIGIGTEECPEKVAVAVYLAALVPNPGQDVGAVVTSPRIRAALKLEPDGLALSFDLSAIRDAFYHDCSEEDIALAKRKLCLQPVAPMSGPTKLSEERFGAVPRHYIECTKDRALSLEEQRRMCATSSFEKIHQLDASHSPFFSQPESLSAILEEITAGLEQRT